MTLREDLLQSPAFIFDEGVFYQKNQPRNLEFEKMYIHLRQKEDRVYSDDIVKNLPDVPSGHPLKSEWFVRKKSLQRLLGYLNTKTGNKKIIEIGCGNGWFSGHLALLSGADVLGIDLNETELLQASRVFKERGNLTFAYANILQTAILSKIDYIVLASSIQYFPDIKVLVNKLFDLLTTQGEIHIIDSPVYKSSAMLLARERSSAYFAKQDSRLEAFYYHHTWKDFQPFRSKLLFNPGSLFNRLRRQMSPDSPFPWIRITK